MVQALPGSVGDPQHLVHEVVEEAANARSTKARRLGFQIQHLANQARLPEKSRIDTGAVRRQYGFELRQHGEGKGSVRRMTTLRSV